MIRKLCFLTYLTYLTSLLSGLSAQTAEYSLRQPATDVNSIVQDGQGYIWVATSQGLARYNGSGYTTWRATNAEGGLVNDNVISLMADDSGCLWIGTECGIGCMSDGVYSHNGEAIFNPITSIVETDDEHILALGKDGFVKFLKDGLRTAGAYHSVGTGWLEQIEVMSDGNVWFAKNSNDSTYLYILDRNLEPLRSDYIGNGVDVSGICGLPDGSVYVAAGPEVLRYDLMLEGREEVRDLKTVLGGADNIHFMLPYRGDQLLLGIAGKGFYAYVPSDGSIRHIIQQQTLSAQKYVCFVDRDDRIWLSDRESGIRTYNPKGIYIHFNPQGEDQTAEVTSLDFDREDFLWVNISGKLCSMDSRSGDVVWESDESLSCRWSYIDSAGRLWVIYGSNDVREYSLRNGRPVLVSRYDVGEEVFSISEDASGRIWLTSVRKFVVIGRDGKVTTVSPTESMPFSMMMSDRSTGRLFLFSVADGLYEVKGDGVLSAVETGGVKSISCVMVASDGCLWMGTYNEGVIRYDESTGELTRFGVSDGLVDASVKSVEEDAEGNIWFTTRSHVYRYVKEDGTLMTMHDDWFVEGRSYSLLSSVRGRDGILYFGGSAGITRVDPSIPFPGVRDVPLSMEQILVNGKPVPHDPATLELSHDASLVNFRFAGLDYDSGPYLCYSYILEGYDRNPTYTYGTGNAVYNHLPSGKYVFRVKVRSSDGHWSSDEIELPVVVRREPVSAAAIVSIVLLAGLAAGAVYALSKMKKQAPAAEETVTSQEEEMPWYVVEGLTDHDKAFLEKIAATLDSNLDSEKFTVNDLAKDMGMSYSSLYSKVKTITGGTPQYFMTAHRMKKAETLLKSGSFSVSEVSYKVGSSSPMTFSREFKKFFGYPPSTLLK